MTALRLAVGPLMQQVNSGPPAFWTPSVSGYVHLWDSSDETEVTDVVGVVLGVGDKGSAAVDLSQGTSALRPSGYGSTPLDDGPPYYRLDGMGFDGDGTLGDYLATSSTTTLSSTFTLVIALRYDPSSTASGADILFEHSTNFTSNPGFQVNYNNTTGNLAFGINRSSTFSSKTYATGTMTNTATVIAIKADGTHAGQRMWRDGVELTGTTVVSNDLGTSNATQAFHIGCRQSDSSLAAPMNWGSLAIWNSALSDANIVTLSGELADHWGF